MIKHGAIKKEDTLFGSIENGIIYTDRGGRIICRNCNSTEGIHVKSWFKQGIKDKFSALSKKCIKCGAIERQNNWTGEIFYQYIPNKEVK